jgi:hypothetical protein
VTAAAARTCLERVRASVGIAFLALQQIDPDHDGNASCPLHEAAALITENAGLQTYYATCALDPQGESA